MCRLQRIALTLCLLLWALLCASPLAGGEPGRGREVPSGYRVEAHDGWRWASPGGRSPPSEDLAEFIDERLDETRRRLGAQGPENPLVVYTPNRGSFERAVIDLGGSRPGKRVVALAFPLRGIMILDGDRLLASPFRRPETIAHEIAHLVLGEGGAQVPRWYHEGVAQWLSGARIDGEGRILLAALARRDGIIPFSHLDPLLADRHILGSIFYRQSLSFVGHVSRRHGEDVHRRILERLSRGEAFQRAFAAVCGEPLEEAEERWRGELRASFSWPAFIFRTVSLFHILAALVIVAFVLQMVRRRRALERMRRAEAPAASAVEEPGRRSEESEEKK